MKKFLITFFPGWGDFRLDFYVQASSEEEAAEKLGVEQDSELMGGDWHYGVNGDAFVRFDEITDEHSLNDLTEVSTPEAFEKIVEQEEKKWDAVMPA